MYERAANPKGAAVVMNIEHCRNRSRSCERGGEAGPLPLAAAFCLLFAFRTGERDLVSRPIISENVWSDFLRMRMYTRADIELRAL